jgi:hypothetical protein
MEQVNVKNGKGSMTTMFTMTWAILTAKLAWPVLLLEGPKCCPTLEGGEPAGNHLRKVINFIFYLTLKYIFYFKVSWHK